MRTKFGKRRWIYQFSPFQILILFYMIAIIIATILLSLPIAQKEPGSIPFIDVLFTAVSALSVTGLSTISIVDSFTTIGHIFIVIILQVGAVGVMAIGTFVWLAFRKKIGLRERQLLMTDQNQTTFGGIVRLMKQIVYLLLAIEVIAFLVLGTYYLKYYPTIKEAYFHGLFSTISAISNGGFDITGQSLIGFKDDYVVQIMTMLLIILGAIGFPVLIEVKEYLFSTAKRHFRFSLFTKLTSITFFLLIVIGMFMIYLLDRNHFFADQSVIDSFFYALFQSVTTRSAGLSTLDVSLLTEENQLFMSLLMFVGASPSSAGGGIRTTTFALVIIFIMTYARGGRNIRIFRREVYEDDLIKAVTVTLVAIFIVFMSVLMIQLFEPYHLNQVLFEVTSAFGTVGLSLGITSELTVFSKIILMCLMFIGRVGIITFLFVFKSDKVTGKYRYPKERMLIG